MFQRHPHNPLITPQQVKPLRPDFEVIGTFNAGVTTYQGDVLLLLRVAERPLQDGIEDVLYPALDQNGELEIRAVPRNSDDYDISDPRLIRNLATGETYLTSISHIRLARSKNGIDFSVADQSWLSAQPPYENYGVEDARVTRLEDAYYINYSAVGSLGISTALVTTTNFQDFKRQGIMFPPANRDVTIFPERWNGQFLCYHRPMPNTVGSLNIWFASSPNMKHWGDHRVVLQSQSGSWEAGRVGGSVPPIKTDQGWLSIYHAADHNDCYCLGAFLTPLDEPWRVIKRSHQPILAPTTSYETQGFFPNVVFSCGAVVTEGQVKLYYGACDEMIGLAEASLDAILASLSDVNV